MSKDMSLQDRTILRLSFENSDLRAEKKKLEAKIEELDFKKRATIALCKNRNQKMQNDIKHILERYAV